MPSKTSRLLTRGRPCFLTVGALGKCFFNNFHNLPGIRYRLFDFVLSFDMETLPLLDGLSLILFY